MSIYHKVRIIFLVAILVTTAFFGSFFLIQQKSHLSQIKGRYIQTALYIHRYMMLNSSSVNSYINDNDFKIFLKESNFIVVNDKHLINEVATEGFVAYEREMMHARMRIIGKSANMYLYVQSPKSSIMLRDGRSIPLFPALVLGSYLLALLVLYLLYLWLVRSFRPLKMLQKQISKVASGDLGVSMSSEGKDEIARVANAFDDALRKLESLIGSRQLFLRSIMHELKTPIAKGRLLNEFLSDASQKDGYDEIFERLELLIDEFAKIEQMLSSSYKLKISRYHAIDMVEQALELMMLDDEQVEQLVDIELESNCVLHTDFGLLSLALKNLIDNAIKYSTDGKVQIRITSHGISIQNIGEKFVNAIDTYKEPFHDQRHGLGLGLYVVHNIMDMLSLELAYDYHDDRVIFEIKSDK